MNIAHNQQQQLRQPTTGFILIRTTQAGIFERKGC